MLQQAELFAERLKSEVGLDPARQAERGFLLALGRPPTNAERDAAAKLIARARPARVLPRHLQRERVRVRAVSSASA